MIEREEKETMKHNKKTKKKRKKKNRKKKKNINQNNAEFEERGFGTNKTQNPIKLQKPVFVSLQQETPPQKKKKKQKETKTEPPPPKKPQTKNKHIVQQCFKPSRKFSETPQNTIRIGISTNLKNKFGPTRSAHTFGNMFIFETRVLG